MLTLVPCILLWSYRALNMVSEGGRGLSGLELGVSSLCASLIIADRHSGTWNLTPLQGARVLSARAPSLLPTRAAVIAYPAYFTHHA
ncbi:hypothetical protein K438DRAFT_1833258 [Mycena galopus ATCC 62051]|nr:hypothetical protein K438DRAFT_1833258 [Mycena galopus ATCC 62051]